jgi:hypothetical protein
MADDEFDPDDIPEPDQPDHVRPESMSYPLDEDDEHLLAPPPAPINWNLLSAREAEHEWLQLNGWVNWLRSTYGLPAAIIPPAWHAHPELVWELSALHTHWLACYHPARDGSGPLLWHADFAAASQRLRNWVAASGTKLDRDRPTRQTVWPGEEPLDDIGETAITDRDADFVEHVVADVQQREGNEGADSD